MGVERRPSMSWQLEPVRTMALITASSQALLPDL
jgi:hypothetical protein